jgi:hypothetical protein
MPSKNPKPTCGHSGHGTLQDEWANIRCAVQSGAETAIRILGTPGSWGLNDSGDPKLRTAAGLKNATTPEGWYPSLSKMLLSLFGMTREAKLQRLIKAQDDARTNAAFQPSAETTHCNQATALVVREVNAPLQPLLDKNGNPLLASEQGKQLAASPLYTEVTQDQSQPLANDGNLVIVSWVSTIKGEPGHVATIRPLGVKGDVPRANSRGPLVNNIGIEMRVEGWNWVFTKAMMKTVKFYTPK